jgi:hypothetical protein
MRQHTRKPINRLGRHDNELPRRQNLRPATNLLRIVNRFENLHHLALHDKFHVDYLA